MSDLRKYISERKEQDEVFSLNFDDGYQAFKIRLMLKEARENSGITQEELAVRLSTKNQRSQE